MQIIVLLICLISFTSGNTTEWQEFKLRYNYSFITNIEDRLRYKIFLNNKKEIEKHNAKYYKGFVTFTKKINQFAVMTNSEFTAFLKLNSNNKMKSTKMYSSVETAPTEIDWRTLGAVTSVKDQGICGSCWSFSAIGSLEGQNKIINGELIPLSVQNLVDCSSSYGNNGCNGGLMDYVFAYVRDNGIESEEDYPYKGKTGICQFSSDKVVFKASGYVDVEEDNEDDLVNAVGTIGPVSVAIDATSNLQFYDSGIFTDSTCSKNTLNHGVLAVGYGSEKDEDFWILKNSWGSSWGESGYIRFQRGVNLCGIATMASFPTL